MAEFSKEIVLVEPWYEGGGHLPFNRAFVRIVREAYPRARVTFACSPGYKNELEQTWKGQGLIDRWVDAEAWTQSSIDGDVREYWRRTRWLVGLLGRVRDEGIKATHFVVLGSSGPIVLALYTARLLRLPTNCKTFTVVHGASGLIHGWQPRSLLLRLFTFRTAIKLLPALAIKVIVLELSMAELIRNNFPRQSKAILCIPHGVDETESLPEVRIIQKARTLRVLFLGHATPHKGFGEFVQLAALARASGHKWIEFRAAGGVRQDMSKLDQSPLTRQAGEHPLKRFELLDELSIADLVFTWQSEYYELTPSGILLDCIAHRVPMTGRRSRAIVELEIKYGACGLFADDIGTLLLALAQLEDTACRLDLTLNWKASLLKARTDRSSRALGAIARRELES